MQRDRNSMQGDANSTQRDYNKEAKDVETHKYAYDFDYVVQGYVMRTLAPFFRSGSALEMGCYEGRGTQRFAEHFNDLTVIEAADELIAVAKAQVPERVLFLHSRFEDAEPGRTFDNIFLIHTLEHLDDPVGVMQRVKHWLSPQGRFFVVVPNANAPSRQIAVKMGLITHNSAVTDAEREHGHRITYTLDTLERDVRQAGFNVQQRGGVFFKPFANFQFDRLLQTDIINEDYLEGCYALGMQYPDLCASIFVVAGCSARTLQS